MKTFWLLGHVADARVIGQIDLHLVQVVVKKSVIVFCSHDDVVDDCYDDVDNSIISVCLV